MMGNQADAIDAAVDAALEQLASREGRATPVAERPSEAPPRVSYVAEVTHSAERAPQPFDTGKRAVMPPPPPPAALNPSPRASNTPASNNEALPFRAGDLIAGKYKVVELIGSGGVGFVMSAVHVSLDEIVALKFLRPQFASRLDAVARFTLEAKANVRIKSDHIVRVLDVDTLPSGAPFIVMEFLEGQDLGRLIESGGPLPVTVAVDYVLQACEALAAAHACHIVHRDVKPDNLFLSKSADAEDQIKVLDFGISKFTLADHTPVAPRPTHGSTVSETAVGSPAYMSPEQVRAATDIDARADIWSLGCVLYELLTGKAPFDRGSPLEACTAVLQDEPPPLRTSQPALAPELDAVVLRCLSKDPAQRFQNIAELSLALAPFEPRRGAQRALACERLQTAGETSAISRNSRLHHIPVPRPVGDVPFLTLPRAPSMPGEHPVYDFDQEVTEIFEPQKHGLNLLPGRAPRKPKTWLWISAAVAIGLVGYAIVRSTEPAPVATVAMPTTPAKSATPATAPTNDVVAAQPELPPRIDMPSVKPAPTEPAEPSAEPADIDSTARSTAPTAPALIDPQDARVQQIGFAAMERPKHIWLPLSSKKLAANKPGAAKANVTKPALLANPYMATTPTPNAAPATDKALDKAAEKLDDPSPEL